MKFNITITASKIFAFVALAIGTIYAFMFKDAVVLISTIGASTGLFSIKTGIEAMKK